MRLVFLLYAEDEALMPADAVYEQNYKLSGIFERLRQDAADYPDTMEQRYSAWAGLMSLCRLVYAGGGATTGYLPARKGQLFDPEAYRWLETPWISDGVVLSVLSNLLVVKGERISYRALDVEQIGSVYEGIMGYAVRRIPGRCIGLKSKPQGAKKQLTTAVDLDGLLELSGGKRKTWLEEEAGTTLPPKAATALKDAGSEAELLEALASRIDQALFDGPQTAGSLVFQPTEERRRSGSHYTPRALTRPIVAEALRPWLERCHHQPNAEQILALKICDPAMGSGAFLVESCRYLAELLELAWNREGLPEALKPGGQAHGEDPLLYARRLIAQSCLYGVDKNPFAVNLARLSLWLVSLSKDAPFTFVDHALKCGDSLVGMERSEIEKALKGASRQREIQMAYLDQVRQQEAKSFATFHADSRSDADEDRKREALDQLNASTAYLRTVGDLLVAAFFNGKTAKDREELKQLYLAATLEHDTAESLQDELAEPLERLREGEKGIQPLHWQLAFPDVFSRLDPGFNLFVGNPPFLGGARISEVLGMRYFEYLSSNFFSCKHQCDLVAYFFRRTFSLLRPRGALGLIATNTIAQGDTREGGLHYILDNDGVIFCATKRKAWPGMAAVIVSVIHISKGSPGVGKTLNGNAVKRISAYLNEGEVDASPKRLSSNPYFSKGTAIYGSGFLFADDDEAATPLIEKEEMLRSNPGIKDRVLPYINGEEINNSPTLAPSRFVIYLSDLQEEGDLNPFQELEGIVRRKVKPGRMELGDNPNNIPLKKRWWAYQASRPELYQRINGKPRALCISRVGKALAFTFCPSNYIFSDAVIVFDIDQASLFGVLQSRIHDTWARVFSSSLKDDLRYTPSDCYETFPLPKLEVQFEPQDGRNLKVKHALEALGEHYLDQRGSLMLSTNQGLTAVYNSFNDPSESGSIFSQMRRLHGELDRVVLSAYGWSDVHTACGFGLDYLDLEDDAQLPDDLQERIDSGELFFWEPDEAGAFEAQVRAYGAVKGKKKLPWRYRWPDEVRDDVLARLLALNAEPYGEEVALGLHNKGGKQGVKAGKRRGRPAKASQLGETGDDHSEQMGLGL
jgi:hypothetical protein